jgi:hypothetical protein
MGIALLNRSWILCALGAWLVLGAGPAWAQVDVPVAVGGRWEGTTEVMSPRFPPTRVLVIRNLRPDTAGPFDMPLPDRRVLGMRLGFDPDALADARRQVATFLTAHGVMRATQPQ